MSPKEFINNVVKSIDCLVTSYSKGREGPTYLGYELDNIGLTLLQREKVLALVKLAVGEATHNIICGIEGAVSLGGSQQSYKLIDETGNELTGELGELLYKKLENSAYMNQG
jgi:hypothetical protein